MTASERNLLIGGIIIALAVMFAIIASVTSTPNFHYEYIDKLGNVGTAASCGQNKGHLVCKDDNRVISVVEYKRVENN